VQQQTLRAVYLCTYNECEKKFAMFNFDELDREDLAQGPTQANLEGQQSLLDHRWVWMGLVVFVVGVLFHNPMLLAISGFMLVAVAFGWLWNRGVTGGLIYKRQFHHRRVFPGETVEVQITVENRKLLPVTWLQIEDEWPMNFSPIDTNALAASSGDGMAYLVNVYALRWYERVKRRYVLQAHSRGVYQVGPAHLVSGDPFSLFERNESFERKEWLIVYPVIKTLDELGMIAKDPFGDLSTAQRLFEDPSRMAGVREYRYGDSFRSVHWKATARTGDLQVKQYEPTRSLSLVFCLNIASFEQHWRGTWPEMIEHLLSVSASLVSWSFERGYSVGVSANAPPAHADRSLLAQPSRNRNHLMHLLELLAGVSYFITQEYSRFILTESSRLPWGATLVLVTGYFNDSILAAILQLRHSGRRIVLIVVGKTPAPDLPGVLIYHLPVLDDEPLIPSDPAAPLDQTLPPTHTDIDTGTHTPTEASPFETPRQRYLRQRAEREKALEP